MKKADNFDASKWLVENKITFQSRLNENKIPGVDVEVDDDMVTLSGGSGDYDGFIEGNGTVSFSVTNDEEDFNDQNWKNILGDDHVFVKIANAINTDVEALGDYVQITVKANDLTSMNESKLNEDLTDEIAALPDFNSAMNREKSELIVGKYAVVRYDESDEGGENMYVVWDNTVNQDEIGSYDDVPEFESEDPAEVAAWLKQNESLNENEKISIENHKDEALETISDFIEEFEPQGLFEFIPSLDNYEIDSSTNSINIDELGSVYLIPNKGPVPNEVKELMMDSNNGEMNEDGATWKKYPKNGYYYIVVS